MAARRRLSAGRLASVRVRITLAATLVVGAALVAGALILVALRRHALVQSRWGGGQLRAAELAAAAARAPLPAVLPPFATPELTLVQLVDTEGRVVAASPQLVGRA